MEAHVLIVEDETLLRQSLAAYLERCGHTVAQAASLAEARCQLAANPFDALILDVGLPDGDGLELLHEAGVARALVVSARPDPARYELHGVRHHLAKPLDLLRVAERLAWICAPA
jgi:DNA-binding response OmpR family regulator